MTRFDYETTIDVRWRDFDALGHVNNAVYATYIEQARLRFLREEFDVTATDGTFVVANLELDFRTPIVEVDSVTAGVGVVDVGRTSFRFGYELNDGNETAARAETVQVVVDADGESTPIPDPLERKLGAAAEPE